MPTAAQAGDLMGAFLRGAGIEGARPENPARTMEALGQVLRATVAGLRQALIARLSVKSEFRIEQTMIRASGNNPLKFSADDDDALAALLGIGRRNTMPPAAAVTEALSDIRLHELATVAAMQQAVRTLLAKLDPASLERQAVSGGFGKLLSQGKARAWDAFVARHTEVSQALSDDFDSVFGKAFARAYEQALRDLTDRDRRP
jgi:type VI secretion system FHA domain protein